jgi:hypothetical protein
MANTEVRGVSVASDVAAFRASVERLKSSQMNRAVAIALNRTADGVQTEAIRMIRDTHRILRREVARAFTIRRAYAGRLEAMVFASGRPLNVIGFEARPSQPGGKRPKLGVSVNIKGTRKVIPGSFVVRIPNNGYLGVFMRKGRSRFPIRAVTTVSVPGLFRRDIVSNAIAGVATDRFRTELAGAVRSILLKGD